MQVFKMILWEKPHVMDGGDPGLSVPRGQMNLFSCEIVLVLMQLNSS